MIWLYAFGGMCLLLWIYLLQYKTSRFPPEELAQGEPWDIVLYEGSFYIYDESGGLVCCAHKRYEDAREHRDELRRMLKGPFR